MKIFEIKNINNNIFYEGTDEIVFKELLTLLNDTKQLIDEDPKKWSECKKCINEYEYVYTSSFSRKNICAKKPISRSYFKILEILKSFQIKDKKKIDCIAEAPGGFVEHFLELDCTINAISLLSKDNSIPHWNHSILKNRNVSILSGADNTGDIYALKNILNYVKKSGKNEREIVTGDGGIDYTPDFNRQELDSYPLIYSEVLMGLLLLKEDGIFICKIFDIMYLRTIKLLYLLNTKFNHMYITKPSMSRTSNSEKYVVCLGYRGYDSETVNLMVRNFQEELNMKVSESFVATIKEFNTLYIANQMNEIKRGVSMKNEDIRRYPSKEQVRVGIKWCKDHGLSINETIFNHRSLRKK